MVCLKGYVYLARGREQSWLGFTHDPALDLTMLAPEGLEALISLTPSLPIGVALFILQELGETLAADASAGRSLFSQTFAGLFSRFGHRLGWGLLPAPEAEWEKRAAEAGEAKEGRAVAVAGETFWGRWWPWRRQIDRKDLQPSMAADRELSRLSGRVIDLLKPFGYSPLTASGFPLHVFRPAAGEGLRYRLDDIRHVAECLEGRLLFTAELEKAILERFSGPNRTFPLEQLEDILQILALAGAVEIYPSVFLHGPDEACCVRCGQSRRISASPCVRCGRERCYFCEECLSMGEARLCRPLYGLSGDEGWLRRWDHDLLPWLTGAVGHDWERDAEGLLRRAEKGAKRPIWSKQDDEAKRPIQSKQDDEVKRPIWSKQDDEAKKPIQSKHDDEGEGVSNPGPFLQFPLNRMQEQASRRLVEWLDGFPAPGGFSASGGSSAPGGFSAPSGFPAPGGSFAPGGFSAPGGSFAPGGFPAPGGFSAPGGSFAPGRAASPGLSSTPEGGALVWAACGAGKTEVAFAAIGQVLRQGGRVLFAVPRRDVVLELAPRIEQAFPGTPVHCLYGGSASKFGDKAERSRLVVATTHQAIRFYRAFDLVVLDEADAFPYQGSAMLYHAVSRSRKRDGRIVLMTATPDQEMKQAVRKKKLFLVTIPARHHGYPLPTPTIVLEKAWRWERERMIFPEGLLRFLHRSVEGDFAQVFLFVPSVFLAQRVGESLKAATRLPPFNDFKGTWVEYSHSRDPEREAKRQRFSRQLFPLFVTTSIMERGITVPRANVVVLFAENERIYDERTLVQMAGRAGRSSERPYGEVWFMATQVTAAMQEAVETIRWLNEQARREGFLRSDGGAREAN
ncbi:conserved hypothetical protein [Heliomicrobium modesticaldum Ice1]|uniref:Uncharacterized protein n=1 Tax=Heliobacterium modesticaldum (strain ATCC 51547 / Ice1) TaxID=498761 RepID=B0TH51_HELMI|nr:DEAD/DEAH box helicase [Heliomicrobium modesticaldum]ABZ83376.1 conserved hypothetical protein [Heliomicrobium modesticaldum Ice1]